MHVLRQEKKDEEEPSQYSHASSSKSGWLQNEASAYTAGIEYLKTFSIKTATISYFEALFPDRSGLAKIT